MNLLVNLNGQVSMHRSKVQSSIILENLSCRFVWWVSQDDKGEVLSCAYTSTCSYGFVNKTLRFCDLNSAAFSHPCCIPNRTTYRFVISGRSPCEIGSNMFDVKINPFEVLRCNVHVKAVVYNNNYQNR